eukprot:CAMPEP_0175672036 /NCGR_PEP_ID=MMETSP0097-20121207/20485_1 /TAXON_ID=311494 /ORGANISM="Alexandrium monilatum, Strain CCMP3105" /LENGTH=86 /DNA_ID=CAMNT_0016978663 /DNA_START=106 /DNA_END=362 /DNA_ORIENTATION=+
MVAECSAGCQPHQNRPKGRLPRCRPRGGCPAVHCDAWLAATIAGRGQRAAAFGGDKASQGQEADSPGRTAAAAEHQGCVRAARRKK